MLVDAPLLVDNRHRQRLAEQQVSQRYGKWLVSANSTNLNSPRQAGVHLRMRLEQRGWRYDDGVDGPPRRGRSLSECSPYATIVGALELGYDNRRPPYKRAKKGTPAAQGVAATRLGMRRAHPARRLPRGRRYPNRPPVAPCDRRSCRGPLPRNRVPIQAPRGPARRRDLRLDGCSVAPTRSATMPGPRHRPRTRRRTVRSHRLSLQRAPSSARWSPDPAGRRDPRPRLRHRALAPIRVPQVVPIRFRLTAGRNGPSCQCATADAMPSRWRGPASTGVRRPPARDGPGRSRDICGRAPADRRARATAPPRVRRGAQATPRRSRRGRAVR